MIKNIKCIQCNQIHEIYPNFGEKFIECPKFWGKKMKVKKSIKRLMTEKYPDIINQIYEEEN